jgi:type I restriction enzyme, S subunit
LQSDYFKKQIASEDTSRYLLLEKGEMVMSGLNFWMGAVDVLMTYDIGIISPDYKVYKRNQKIVDSSYFRYLVRSEKFINILVDSSNERASIVRRNLVKEDFYNSTMDLPPLEEQIRIAEVLTTLDTELEGLRGQLQRVKTQKKGLMQHLLTGKTRVKV